jgi:hypothetical protein
MLRFRIVERIMDISEFLRLTIILRENDVVWACICSCALFHLFVSLELVVASIFTILTRLQNLKVFGFHLWYWFSLLDCRVTIRLGFRDWVQIERLGRLNLKDGSCIMYTWGNSLLRVSVTVVWLVCSSLIIEIRDTLRWAFDLWINIYTGSYLVSIFLIAWIRVLLKSETSLICIVLLLGL